MPYNTTAIPRPEPDEITGTSALPLARVKKIIAQDDDIAQCSQAAAFAISVATEEFLRYLTEQAFNVAKSESKPRRNIAYKDIATAVSKFDNLQFLSDTVPKTMTYKQFKDKAAASSSSDSKPSATTTATNPTAESTAAHPLTNGHHVHHPTTTDDTATSSSRSRSIADMMTTTNGDGHDATVMMNGGEPASPTRTRQISHSMAHSPIVDRTALHEQERRMGVGGRNRVGDGDGDVEMGGVKGGLEWVERIIGLGR